MSYVLVLRQSKEVDGWLSENMALNCIVERVVHPREFNQFIIISSNTDAFGVQCKLACLDHIASATEIGELIAYLKCVKIKTAIS
jgi:hypothetical protein